MYTYLLLNAKDSIISPRENKYIKILASLINPTERPRFRCNKLTHRQHNGLMITNDVVATANSPNMAAHTVLRWHCWWSGTSPVVAVRCVVVACCSWQRHCLCTASKPAVVPYYYIDCWAYDRPSAWWKQSAAATLLRGIIWARSDNHWAGAG